MRKITFILTYVVLSAFLACCDKIEEPYLQYDESVETTVDFPELDKTSVYKKVLVEEFTGHRCSNCPEGHRMLTTLSGEYGDTLIAVCIHAGYFSLTTDDFPTNFQTQEGTELYNDFTVGATPRAIFNQSQYEGNYALNVPAWPQALQHFSQQPAVAAIQMINEFSDNTLTTHTQTTFLTGYSEPVKLALYIIEDQIVSPQIDDTDTLENYVHNHVLRAAINGTYGTYVSGNGMVVEDTGYTKSYQLSCAGKPWNVAHCSVVAILMDATTQEVLQVEKCAFLNE